MQKVIFLFLSVLMSLPLMAQDFPVVRGDCMPEGEGDAVVSHGMKAPRRLRTPNTSWDASRTYHQLVILFTFKETNDTTPAPTLFQSANPREEYDRMLNEPGYNQRNGAGCMADYFRVQSGGLFNMQFDVYGPYMVNYKAKPDLNATESTRNYGVTQMREATQMFLTENPDIDFSQYDWNNDGNVNQVIYVYAGLGGNNGSTTYGHIWPNTSSFSTITTKDGKKISDYSASAEIWPTRTPTSCGIGTICHEFTHSLGLPDIYPTADGLPFSMVDEWDLMDGGNFTNYGWCPPNYTPLEKMLLGWLTPVELTGPTTVKDLKPVSEGGQVYIIKNTDKEYYLLENRQWRGWDVGVPGQGLVIYHVNYDASVWSTNKPNNTKGAPRFALVHADNMDYDAWGEFVDNNKLSTYADAPRLHNRFLSTSPYPYNSDPVVNALTDTSLPAATMYNANAETGEFLLSKPITNITMSSEGLISFDFMGGSDTTGIDDVNVNENDNENEKFYDLLGRRTSIQKGLLIIREKNGSVKKIIRK